MNRTRLLLVSSASVFLLVGGLVACSAENREAVAAGKCGLPVGEALVGPVAVHDNPPEHHDVQVTDLGEGRYRVSGMALTRQERPDGRGEVTRGARFVCEVAPDESDTLRGFKVTRLDVDEARRLR